jgi:hypothetical protein
MSPTFILRKFLLIKGAHIVKIGDSETINQSRKVEEIHRWQYFLKSNKRRQ